MAKVDNNTKGWGNVLKPQNQADTVEVIQPREMKPDELVAVLDKMSDKGSKPVKCGNCLFCYDMAEDMDTYPCIKEFKFDPGRNRYFGHLENTALWLDTKVMGKETIAAAMKQLSKQQLAEEIGVNTEYKLPKPLNVRLGDLGDSEAVIDSVKITKEYGELNFTYKGKETYNGKTYEENFDPEQDDVMDSCVVADICKNVLDTIAKEKNVAIGKGLAQAKVDVLEKIIFSGEGLPHLHPDPNSAPHLSHDELLKMAGDDNISTKGDYVNTVKGFLEAVGMKEGDTLVLPEEARIQIDKSLPPINRLEMKYDQVLAGANNTVSIGLLSEAEQKALLRTLVDIDTKNQFKFIPTSEFDKMQEQFRTMGTDILYLSESRFHKDHTGKIEMSSDGFYSTPIHETRMAEAARHAPLSDSDYAEKELRAEADAKVEKAIHDRFEELMKESEKEEQSKGIKR